MEKKRSRPLKIKTVDINSIKPEGIQVTIDETEQERRRTLLAKVCKELVEEEHETRMRGLKEVKRLLAVTAIKFTETDLLKLWKGLFMLAWATDKPIVQEMVNDRLAELVGLYKYPEFGMEMVRVFFKTMCINWDKIDRFRLDKYMSLVRKMLRASFDLLKRYHENKELADALLTQLVGCLRTEVFNPVREDTMSNGLILHVADIYLVELYRVTEGSIEPDHLNRLLLPIIGFLSKTDDNFAVRRIKERVFIRLLTTYSPFGERDPWMLDEIEHIDDETGERIPLIFPTDYLVLSKLLFKIAASRNIPDHNRKILHLLRQKCEEADKKLKELEEDAENVLTEEELAAAAEEFGEDDDQVDDDDEVENQDQDDEDEDDEEESTPSRKQIDKKQRDYDEMMKEDEKNINDDDDDLDVSDGDEYEVQQQDTKRIRKDKDFDPSKPRKSKPKMYRQIMRMGTRSAVTRKDYR